VVGGRDGHDRRLRRRVARPSFFFEEQETTGPTTADVLVRLAVLEQKLDALTRPSGGSPDQPPRES
jgi:hypothetical protein